MNDPRVTAYFYVHSRGLMDRYGSLDWLFEIGRRAASEARWRGIEPYYVWEGLYGVNSWPEQIWAQVIAQMEREEKTAFADAATAQEAETRDAGWGEGQVPWDGDDIRSY